MMPLSMCKPGTWVEIKQIRGRRLRERLWAMGVGEGTRARVLQGHGLGVILVVDNRRVALGRGAAHKILVDPLGGFFSERSV